MLVNRYKYVKGYSKDFRETPEFIIRVLRLLIEEYYILD